MYRIKEKILNFISYILNRIRLRYCVKDRVDQFPTYNCIVRRGNKKKSKLYFVRDFHFLVQVSSMMLSEGHWSKEIWTGYYDEIDLERIRKRFPEYKIWGEKLIGDTR